MNDINNMDADLREALRDMLAGWRYIRETYGDLYGVGWDRAEDKARAALASAPVADERECGNGDCGWRGTTGRMCGSVGPLCPECGETTEAIAPVAGESKLPWHVPVQHWTDEEKAKLDAAPQASEAVRKPVMTVAEFCAEAGRLGLTAHNFAAQLAGRPEFADCLPHTDKDGAQSPDLSEKPKEPPCSPTSSTGASQ